MVNKYGQNVQLSENEKLIRGYKRRRLVLGIIIIILFLIIGIQVTLYLMTI